VKCYVAIAGNIGVGKSSLTRLLSQKLQWRPIFEAYEQNPYLSDFYDDMAHWAFHSQVFFLTKRIGQHHVIAQSEAPVVQDRTIYEDAEVFAKNLYLRGSLNERDWCTYYALYAAVSSLLIPPDLVVYLKASVPTLLKRISSRSRSFERRISEEYLASLNGLYDKWAEEFTLCPLLIVNSDEMDFVHSSDCLDIVVRMIEKEVHGKDKGTERA